jgi:hypothetical protein
LLGLENCGIPAPVFSTTPHVMNALAKLSNWKIKHKNLPGFIIIKQLNNTIE